MLTGTLTGTFQKLDGTPHAGAAYIDASVPAILDAAGNIVFSGRITAPLDAAGSFSVTLPAVDDPDLNPTGFTYSVNVGLSGTRGSTTRGISVLAGQSLDMADVTPVASPPDVDPIVTYLARSERGAADGVASLDGAALVPQAQLPAHLDPSTIAATYAPKSAVTGQVALAENRTGTATVAAIFPANATTVPSCVIEVQPTGDLRAIIEAQVCWRLTAAGPGTLDILLYEITGGTATLICEDKLPVSGDLGTTGIFPNQRVAQDIGPVATARQFALYVRIRRTSGSSLAAEAINAAGVGTASFNRHSAISARTA